MESRYLIDPLVRAHQEVHTEEEGMKRDQEEFHEIPDHLLQLLQRETAVKGTLSLLYGTKATEALNLHQTKGIKTDIIQDLFLLIFLRRLHRVGFLLDECQLNERERNGGMKRDHPEDEALRMQVPPEGEVLVKREGKGEGVYPEVIRDMRKRGGEGEAGVVVEAIDDTETVVQSTTL